MKNKKTTRFWIVDLALFAAFLLTFFMDLTGLAMHQLIGIFVGLLSFYHLILHWNWVKCVVMKCIADVPSKTRLNVVLDAALMSGMAAIILSGLLISTWLNLTFLDYLTVKTLHIVISFFTLLVLLIKIAVHARWVICATRTAFARKPAMHPALPAIKTPVPVAVNQGRREFIRLMGVVGAGAALATFSVIKGNVMAQPAAPSTPTSTATTSPETAAGTTPAAPAIDSPAVAGNAQPMPDATSTVQAIAPTPTAQAQPTSCYVQCNRQCAYPGQCRKYVDANQNGYCDRGECS